MQITDIADAMIVGRLFEALFEAGVYVVTTSNRHPSELYKDGLNRQLFLPFINLLQEKLEVDQLDAMTDYRQDRLAGEQVYFHPADADARVAIDRLWQDLTEGRQEELVLEVKGREVHLPRYWAGMARASFWDLCGQPLGPADPDAAVGDAGPPPVPEARFELDTTAPGALAAVIETLESEGFSAHEGGH